MRTVKTSGQSSNSFDISREKIPSSMYHSTVKNFSRDETDFHFMWMRGKDERYWYTLITLMTNIYSRLTHKHRHPFQKVFCRMWIRTFCHLWTTFLPWSRSYHFLKFNEMTPIPLHLLWDMEMVGGSWIFWAWIGGNGGKGRCGNCDNLLPMFLSLTVNWRLLAPFSCWPSAVIMTAKRSGLTT